MMAGGGGRLSARVKNLAGLRLRGKHCAALRAARLFPHVIQREGRESINARECDAGDNPLSVPVPVNADASCLYSLTPGDFPGGNRAVMLRTEPAALSLPGPSGAAGFHPLSQQQACSDRNDRAALCRAVAGAPCIPAKDAG
ncbi:TPA: hypothetical protein IBX06_004800, partial [Escherichia coli]|nr:hypothetical protein [Escherichia coli]